ncbi:TonB-dependent receptor [Pseudoxanthomonas mexicana]|uniref:TonB-dependent receptor domain-containing protein n=1 Tax=Pseudoxanthomonas mexicana TaxID=128785 RepID=UPI000782E4CB|nr:TonB-dependent receptor [Pseudoxanthomonas mexicana]
MSAAAVRPGATPPRAERRGRGSCWLRLPLLLGLASCIALSHAQDRAARPSSFAIAPQSLEDALIAFSEQSGIQFVAIGDLKTATRTPTVRGVLDNEEALRRLLAGSGFGYTFRASGVVTISRDLPVRGPLPATPATASAPAPIELAGVQVTARRRTERSIDVPLAVTALDGQQLDGMGIANAALAIDSVPGASSVDIGGGFTQVQIRGVSSSLGGNDNGYYLDDIPFTGVTVPWHPDARAFDLDRVEVLRGPQGTLFGEGSMGGTVRILTRKPELDRLSLLAQGGWSTASGGGSGWSAKLMANLPVFEDRLAVRVVATDESLPGWVDDATDGRRDINTQRVRTRRLRATFLPTERWRLDAAHWSYRSSAPGGGYAADDAMQVAYYYGRDADWTTSNLVSTYEGDTSALTYTYAEADLAQRQQGEILPDTAYDSAIDIGVRTHELRWSSTGQRTVAWTVGAYRRQARRLDASAIGEVAPSRARQENDGGALFGDATVQLPNPAWSVNLGLRYFEDQVQGVSLTGDAQTMLDEQFHSWNPRLGLSWTPADDTTVYASLAKGFRSGQLQPITSFLLAQAAGIELPTRIAADRIITAELGAKALAREGRVLVEAAVFQSRWRDVPVRVPVTDVFNGLVNSDGAKIRGAEIGLTWKPRDSLSFQLESAWVDAAYTADVAGTPITRGSPVYNTPRLTWGAAGEYHRTIARGMQGIARAGVRYHSARQASLTQGSPGDDILSAHVRLGVETAAGWSLAVYGDNLTNEQGADDARTTRGVATRLRPRTLGVELQVRY